MDALILWQETSSNLDRATMSVTLIKVVKNKK